MITNSNAAPGRRSGGDRARLQELAERPLLFDNEVEELAQLAAGLGLLVTVERVDFANEGRRSRYTIGGAR